MISADTISPAVLTTIEVLGTLAFALSGLVVGARKRLDAVGVAVVAFLAAFGGGTLRDILLDKRPFFWVEHGAMLWMVMALACLGMLVLRQRHLPRTEALMQWPDTLGLGLFAATGAYQAWLGGLPALVVVLMGVITGVFGGVLRDIVCNEIPNAFKDHRPYALCAFAGGWVLVVALSFDVADGLAVALSAAATVLFRTLAVYRNWRLPEWRL